jgi:hypothetical protein
MMNKPAGTVFFKRSDLDTDPGSVSYGQDPHTLVIPLVHNLLGLKVIFMLCTVGTGTYLLLSHSHYSLLLFIENYETL